MATLKGWLAGTLGQHPNQNNGTFEWEDLLNGSALLNAITQGKYKHPNYMLAEITPSGTIDTPANDLIEEIIPNITETLDAGNKGELQITQPNTESETPNTELNNVTDSTNENIETPINSDILSFMQEQQTKRYRADL